MTPAEVAQAHAVDDLEQVRTRVLRCLTVQTDLLAGGLHAVQHDRPLVAEEFIERALTALKAEIARLSLP